MDRTLVHCSEGYWNLIDDFGKLICRFKVGDRVKIAHVHPIDALQSFDKYNWGEPQEVKVEEEKGYLDRVSYFDCGCVLELVGRKRYIHTINIKSILKMKVIK